MDIQYGGVKANADDVFCTVEPDGAKAGITIYIRGLQPENQKIFSSIGFLMLDQALGEYDVEIKVGFVEIKDFSVKSALEKKPIKEVTQIFDAFWKNKSENPTPKPTTPKPNT